MLKPRDVASLVCCYTELLQVAKIVNYENETEKLKLAIESGFKKTKDGGLEQEMAFFEN